VGDGRCRHPVEGVTLEDCVALAKRVGQESLETAPDSDFLL